MSDLSSTVIIESTTLSTDISVGSVEELLSGSIVIDSLLESDLILDLSLSGTINSSSSIGAYLLMGSIEEYLTGNSNVISSSSSEEMIVLYNPLIGTSSSYTITESIIGIEVRCINCTFNSKKASSKNRPRCFRDTRLKDESTKSNCKMYKSNR